jgi:SAM-dependent methyltransferase
LYPGGVSDDTWAKLADQFADQAYASVKGYVRTYVMHQQLLEHLPPPPGPVLDVGGGAGHQSFPLAQAGYDVTLLDSSPAMLDKARQRLARLPAEDRRRVTLLQGDGERADEAVNGGRFAAVLCHGVLGYLDDPEPLVDQLCRCAAAGGVVSIMTGNAKAAAVRPAMERRWDDALASFDARTEIGVLGVPGRADTVEELSELVRSRGVEPLRWYGVWLFVDWLEFSGAELGPGDSGQLAATAAVELEASRRDPYRQLSRVFHLVGRKGPALPSLAGYVPARCGARRGEVHPQARNTGRSPARLGTTVAGLDGSRGGPDARQVTGRAEVVTAEPAACRVDSAAEATQAMQISVPAAATAAKPLCLATHDLLPGARRGPGPGWRSCGSGP